MSSPLIDLLLQQPNDVLETAHAATTKQVDELRRHLAVLDMVMAMKTPEPNLRRSVVDVVPLPDGSVVAPASKRRRSAKRERVVNVLASGGNVAMTSAELQRSLSESGMESSPESVRVLLRRMDDDGVVVREGDAYKLPPEVSALNGAAPDGEQMSGQQYDPQGALAPHSGGGPGSSERGT